MLNPRGNNFELSEFLTAGEDCLSVDILYLEKSDNTNVSWTDITREPVCVCHTLLSVPRLSTQYTVSPRFVRSKHSLSSLKIEKTGQ